MGAEEISILKMLGVLMGVASAITAPVLAFFKYNTKQLAMNQREMIDEMQKSTSSSIQDMQTNIENRITNFHKVMDHRTNDLKFHFDKELRMFRESQAEADKEIKSLSHTLNERDRHLHQKIHDNEKALLEFRLDVNSNFERKDKKD